MHRNSANPKRILLPNRKSAKSPDSFDTFENILVLGQKVQFDNWRFIPEGVAMPLHRRLGCIPY